MNKKFVSLLLCVCLLCTLCTVAMSPASAATSLPFTVSYGTTDGAVLTDPIAYDEATNAALATGIADGVTVNSTTGIPYQIFTVDVSGLSGDEVTLTVNAATIENERLALKVFNPSANTWDTLATAVSSDEALSAKAAIATYADGGKVKAMVTPDYIANGSNRLIWSTDQQHYTKFEDLNQTYYDIHHYVVDEYKNGRTAYLINTGDIVDDTPLMAGAKGQWVVADKAFDILDEANVPYGIVTGNHDVGDYPTNNYGLYYTYFNEERYADRPWYGGTADDNGCHYDLVTAGNKDLLFLYFGYGLEVMDPEWAKSVIEMYPHRSVIICTHQYLSPTTLEHKGRAKILFDTLVTPYENVVMVLSGHYEGAGYSTKTIGDRIVQEVVADYQFVQKESEQYYIDKGVKDPMHKIGGVPSCNGEGYLREVIIDGNTVDMYGFSPVTGGVTPFGARDDLSLTIDFVPTQRHITTYAFAAGDSVADLSELTAPADGVTVTAAADRDNLEALIDAASDLKKKDYTADSFATFKEALKAAKSAVKSADDAQVSDAAQALAIAKGALAEKQDGIDRDKLTLVHQFDLDIQKWENGDGPKSFASNSSYIDIEATEGGGFVAQKSAKSIIGWPSVKYDEILHIEPEDGKVYLYLDIEAGSTWSVYPSVIQDGTLYQGRWNYVIEGSYKSEYDAGCGTYKGVYDVTQALVDLGVDPTKEMTITFSACVVPGPITFNEIALLTGDPGGFALSGDLLWILGGGVLIVALAVVAIVILRKPKKAAPADVQPEASEPDAE